MPTILLISDDTLLRDSIRQSIKRCGTTVLGVPNTREILYQPGARQVFGYDLIVAEVRSGDHDGLSRLVLFRNLHPNTPFIAVTRENEEAGLAYGGSAARALRAWLVPVTSDCLSGLTDTAMRALTGEWPPLPEAHAR
ncbi:MAG: Response regulator [Nitrospira sp.]|nr:MAG: Response regulator [Nitrospira sp.]